MVKKVIGYILLCCFSNVLTTLPARCCEIGGLVHRHIGNGPGHSQTVLQYLIDIAGDDSPPGDDGIDVHCSVFNESRPVSVQSGYMICKSGDRVGTISVVAAACPMTFLYSRPFPVPHHHNFLFRLTPF